MASYQSLSDEDDVLQLLFFFFFDFLDFFDFFSFFLELFFFTFLALLLFDLCLSEELLEFGDFSAHWSRSSSSSSAAIRLFGKLKSGLSGLAGPKELTSSP